jgi:ferrochelatase
VTIGVVVMAYGTPSSLEEVESYYTHIRRGRPPTAELLDALRSRYDAIGGVSPLRQITEAQAARLQAALGDGYRVTLGLKHSSPFIEDAVPADVERVVGVVLAPHYSRGSVGEYLERLREAAAGQGLEATGIESWCDLDAWIEFEADALRDALAAMPLRTTVLFTAHSLPERVLEGDPYPDQLETSAAAIAQRAGIERWRLAWQSSPRGARAPDPARPPAGTATDTWRGPDILEVLPELDADGVAVCPQGFTADHLEVLYDLDIEAAGRARDVGLAFARTRSLNDDEGVLTALAERIKMQ